MSSTRFRTLPTVTQPAAHGFPRVPRVAASLPGFLRKHGRGCATRREGRVSSEIEAAQPCPIREKHVGRRTRCNAVQRLFVQTPFARKTCEFATRTPSMREGAKTLPYRVEIAIDHSQRHRARPISTFEISEQRLAISMPERVHFAEQKYATGMLATAQILRIP